MAIKRWDIFCRVVDNYGDVGVCWRLARQLANEYHYAVRLWVDELEALQQIWPNATLMDEQHLEQVEVRRWQEPFPSPVTVPDVVIEAFACDLPESYLLAMKARQEPPYWFNLEYLSAERWVEDCHGLLSTHPRLGLRKIFFFPGFSDRTGGLIKEAGLLENCKSYLSNQSQVNDFFRKFYIAVKPGELLVSLFGYENSALPHLLEHWTLAPSPVFCLVPASKLLPDINRFAGRPLAVGEEYCRGSLRIKVIPFLTQTEYDYLLWSCDINFVRGEDSFVRAQWAGKPFVWHIYPQDDQIHMEKLTAFLDRFLPAPAYEHLDGIRQLWLAWNQNKDPGAAWAAAIAQLNPWRNRCEDWRQELNSLGDLASKMVHFCQKTI